MKVRDTVSKDSVIREVFFDDEDIQFVVEGYEFAEDEMKDMACVQELEGDYFHKTYNNFKDAVEKYLELLEAGWETVRFYIRLKPPKILEEVGVSLLFDVNEYNTSLGILINSTKLCESYAKKLIEIERILREKN